jgi:chemotaxis protein CheC
MVISQRQQEALSELINIGYGRSAASLSQLTGQKISLSAPKVGVHSMDEVRQALGEAIKGEVWSVHQIFSGPLSGHSLLLLGNDAVTTLTELVAHKKLTPEGALRTKREVLIEVGNIVLHGGMGICGDMLKVHVKFAVPGLRIESIDQLLSTVTVDEKEVSYAILVRTRFHIVGTDVSGYFVVVLGVTSFAKLIDALDGWEARGGGG